MINKLLEPKAISEILAGERKGDCDWHGPAHWFKVSQLAVLLAESEGADKEVALLFGFYHDCRRDNDGYDPSHGVRASALLVEHHKLGLLHITERQLDKLSYACIYHNQGLVEHDDKTIASCWDADRLDLPRCGTQTDPSMLGTAAGKVMAEFQNGLYYGDSTYGYRN